MILLSIRERHTMKTEKMKIAVVGLGDIARKAYLPILTSYDGLDLLFYNRSKAPLEEYQKRYRVAHGTTSLEEVVDRQPTAAFVLTASPSHFEIVKTLLNAGIDVFVEKPATLHSSETRELAELADEKGRILMVGFNRRYAPLHVRAKQIWGDTPVSMGVFTKFRPKDYYPDLAHQLVDDNIHQIDTLRFFCGNGHAVSVTQETTSEKIVGAVCTIKFDNGGIGVLETNMRAGRWEEHYALYGGQKTMRIDVFSKVTLTQGEDQLHWAETYDSSWKPTLEGRGFVGEIEHFFSCVKERQMPQTSAWDSVKTQLLIEEIIALSEKESGG